MWIQDSDLAETVAGMPWVVDGVSDAESIALDNMGGIASHNIELAKTVASLPWFANDLTTLNSYVIDAIDYVTGLGDGEFHEMIGQLIGQPWVTDGLDQEESAFFVALVGAALIDWDGKLHNDLIRTHFTQKKRVSLPLSGDINIWIFQDEPFPPDEDPLSLIEDTLHSAERFLGTPFPTTDIILLIVPSEYNRLSGAFAGEYYGTHMAVLRFALQAIPHETAHYYFNYDHFDPGWLVEGGAEFIQSYLNDQTGFKSISDRRIEVSMAVQYCSDNGIENLRHNEYLGTNCWYTMGENFLLSIFETIGEEATSAALRELYLQSRESVGRLATPATEEAIYNAFLKHTPADKKGALRGLYQTLHGGAFAFDTVPFDDDHGDELSAASDIAVGEAVEGTLDYMFDFDYFKFQAEEGQKYRIAVNHESLGASSITLYTTEELPYLISSYGLNYALWKSRTREASGPQIQWVAPSSDEYYFAVQNFGGKTGDYTLTITPVASIEDDHGDTLATATNISPGETVHGAVDYDFDLDYFRFQAVEGKSYRVEIEIGTLEFYHHHLYTADGVPNDLGIYVGYREESVRVDATTVYKWTPWSSGTFYFAIDGVSGSVGSYAVSIIVDDHGDEPSTASEITLGEAVEGTIDYAHDYDYFKFQTEMDQKYRITVNGHFGIDVHTPDQVYFAPVKSRTWDGSDIQIQWVAPSSHEYYLAVHNHGGKTGDYTYTITITPVSSIADDHGDTIATATNISLGEVVQGTVDGDFDFDYFGFQAVEGRNYRILITGGAPEYFRFHVYTADGVPHDAGYETYLFGAEWQNPENIDWTPSSSGTYYLAIDGADGSVGSYTVTITEVEGGSGD